jgi:hypothetical protein
MAGDGHRIGFGLPILRGAERARLVLDRVGLGGRILFRTLATAIRENVGQSQSLSTKSGRRLSGKRCAPAGVCKM